VRESEALMSQIQPHVVVVSLLILYRSRTLQILHMLPSLIYIILAHLPLTPAAAVTHAHQPCNVHFALLFQQM
jgi:hypothetical protein